MKQIFFRLRWFLIVSISLITILAVVTLSAMRLALPYITDYGQTIEQKLTEELGQKVTIGKLDSDWEWFSPRLRVSDVYIYKKNQKSILVHFDDVYFSFSLWRNVFNLNFEPGEITLVGTSLNIKRTLDNQLQVQGYSLTGPGQAAADQNLLNKLLLNRRYSLFDAVINLQDEQRNAARFQFKVSRFVVQSQGDDIGLVVDSELPAELGKNISVIVKAGHQGKWTDWNSQLYLKGSDLNLPRLLSYAEQKYLDLDGKADLEFWSVLENASIKSFSGKVRSNSLVVAKKNLATGKISNWQAQNLSTNFLLEKHDNVWQLVLDKLSMQVAEHKWINAHLDFYINQDTRSIGIKTDYLDLSDVDNLLSQLDITDISEQFKKIRPVGNLHNAEIIIQDWSVLDHWYIKSKFSRLGGRLPNGAVRLEGLDGEILLSKNKGFVSLDSDQIKLVWDQIKTPIILQRFKTNIALEQIQDGMILRSNKLVTVLDKVDLNARFEMMFSDQVFIDMQWKTGKTTADWAKKYMPDALLGKTTAQWLRDSIQKAETDSINVLYHGLVSEFPFIKAQGVSQVMLDISNGMLKYLPSWPPINNIAARFNYENDHIRIDHASGVTVNSQITKTVTDINLLGEPHVVVDGHVVSNSINLDKFLTTTPLANSYQQFSRGLAISGNAACDLKLDIPLKKNAQVDVQGDVSLQGNSLYLQDLGYRITDINGLLSFKNMAIKADNLSAKIEGKSLQTQISTNGFDNRIATHISVNMEAGFDEVIPGKLKFHQLYQGDARWNLDLWLYHAEQKNKPSLDLLMKGNLAGVELLLPEPLAKKASEKASMEFRLKKIADKFYIAADYNQQLMANVSWLANDDPSNLSGQINLMTPLEELPEEGFGIAARLKSLDINAWKNVLSPYLTDTNNDSRLIDRINISSEKVTYNDLMFNALSLDATRKENYWKLMLNSNAVKGNGLIPEDWSKNLPINLSFDKLDLTVLEPPAEIKPQSLSARPATAKTPRFSPVNIPPLTITARDVNYRDYKFERINLETSRDKRYGMTIHLLEAYGKELVIQSNGKWLVDNKGEHQTSLRFELSSDNIGRMLAGYQVTDSLKQGEGEAVIEWSWPSEPYDFGWQNVTGQMQVKISNGHFEDIDPGAGRLLGMFSLSALPQRFLLDFSDTFSKGFEFDKLISQANFANGHLYTSKTEISGSAADIYFSGRIGLVAKDYDQVMTVVPRISSGISGWLAVLQGAAVGLTAYIGQKILGVDEAAKDQYHISGTWSDPVIEKIRKVADKTKANTWDE